MKGKLRHMSKIHNQNFQSGKHFCFRDDIEEMVIETDEEKPVPVMTIDRSETPVKLADGYRLRLKFLKEAQNKSSAKRYLDPEAITGYINETGLTKEEFAKQLGISDSNFKKMMDGTAACEGPIQHKLLELFGNEEKLELLFKPLPICIGGREYQAIHVTDLDHGLVASITSQSIICDNEYEVECIPYYPN